MSSHGEGQFQTNTGNRQMKRHHTARYYVHRVHENLTTRVSKLLCAIFLSLLLVVGLIFFILWLNLRPHRPRFHIMNFSLPSLTQETGFENAAISFDVTARNSNQKIGIYYDAMDGAVYYRDHLIGDTPLQFPSYQPPKNTTWIHGELSGATLTATSERWKDFVADRAAGTVAFRLELTSTIRFKVKMWGSKHHKMHASCEALVGQDGLILATSKEKKCPLYFS